MSALDQLSEFSRQLSDGTTSQKRRAWKALVRGGGLWNGCAAAMGRPEGIERLVLGFDLLRHDWERSPLVELEGGDARRVDESVTTCCRLLAAAAVALLARLEADDAAMAYWASAAVDPDRAPETRPPAGLREPGAGPAEAARVHAAFEALGEIGTAGASARDAALGFLAGDDAANNSPSDALHVPVLLAGGNEGFVTWLWLVRVEGGAGRLFQAPATLLDPIHPCLRQSMAEAASRVHRFRSWPAATDVRWWLSHLPLRADGSPAPVGGRSAQASMTVGLALMLAGGTYNRCCVISATVTDDGRLGPVEGLSGPAPKLRAASRLRPAEGPVVVVVSPENRPSHAAAALWLEQGVRVVTAETLDEAEAWAAASAPEGPPGPRGPRPALQETRAPTPPPRGNRIVLLYARHDPADRQLTETLAERLRAAGCRVFVDQHPDITAAWAREVEREVRNADLIVVLLSRAGVGSEMLAYEVEVAHATLEQSGGAVRLCSIHMARDSGAPVEPLPEPLAGALAGSELLSWTGPEDTDALADELVRTLRQPLRMQTVEERARLVPPVGVLPLDSRYYVPRLTDSTFLAALTRQDSIVRIKGARQMGKTSLLARGLDEARRLGASVCFTDFQALNAAHLASVDTFFLALARWLTRQLRLDLSPDDVWDPLLGPNWNFREFLLGEVLERLDGPLVWGMDEVDRLLPLTFAGEVFGLFRSWHNERSLDPDAPWSRLTLAMAYSAEAHLFIKDANQSPFNVGTRVSLADFTPEQVADLNGRYGSPLKSPAELDRYYGLLSGHPYLSHHGIHEMAVGGLDLSALEVRAAGIDGLFGDHLQRLLLYLAGDSEASEAVRAVLRGEPCAPPAFLRLASAGVLVGTGPRQARLRCRLYEIYLGAHLG